jgi:hypothetical protein
MNIKIIFDKIVENISIFTTKYITFWSIQKGLNHIKWHFSWNMSPKLKSEYTLNYSMTLWKKRIDWEWDVTHSSWIQHFHRITVSDIYKHYIKGKSEKSFSIITRIRINFSNMNFLIENINLTQTIIISNLFY